MRAKIAMGNGQRGGIPESYVHLLLQPPPWVEIHKFKSQPSQMVWRLLKGVRKPVVLLSNAPKPQQTHFSTVKLNRYMI